MDSLEFFLPLPVRINSTLKYLWAVKKSTGKSLPNANGTATQQSSWAGALWLDGCAHTCGTRIDMQLQWHANCFIHSLNQHPFPSLPPFLPWGWRVARGRFNLAVTPSRHLWHLSNFDDVPPKDSASLYVCALFSCEYLKDYTYRQRLSSLPGSL